MLTVHLRIHFTSRGAEPGSYTATQLCGKLLTVVGHYAQWDWGEKKTGLLPACFSFLLKHQTVMAEMDVARHH